MRNVVSDSGRFNVVTRQKCSFETEFEEEIKRGSVVSASEYTLHCFHKCCHIYLFVGECVV